MTKKAIQTTILATSTVAAALLAIAGLGFSAPTGELSKLEYNGNYWCVSNWIEEEDANGNRVMLPDPDGRGRMDHRLKDKTDWIRLDQIEADTKEEAEQKALRKGLFEPSEKVALREALDKSDKAFFTSHFNTGATHPGPCVGTGSGNGKLGIWINDAIRKDCFGIETPTPVVEQIESSSNQNTNQESVGICTGGNGVPEAYARIFRAAGQKFGVNPAWVAALFAAENSVAIGRSNIVVVKNSSMWPSLNKSWRTSSAGAQGPMQFMPGTWPSHAQDGNGDGRKDVQNVYDAIFAGAHYVSTVANVSSKNPPESLLRRSAIAYNAGPRKVDSSDGQLPAETRSYILKTREAFRRYNCP